MIFTGKHSAELLSRRNHALDTFVMGPKGIFLSDSGTSVEVSTARLPSEPEQEFLYVKLVS